MDGERLEDHASPVVQVDGTSRKDALEAAQNVHAALMFGAKQLGVVDVVVSIMQKLEFHRARVEVGTYQKPPTGGPPVVHWKTTRSAA